MLGMFFSSLAYALKLCRLCIAYYPTLWCLQEHHLRSHQFTHTGLRPYCCPVCGRSFNQRANMQRHMLIHKAERSYKCDYCDKTFTQPQTLKAHMVVHADHKPYKCSLCGESVATST